MRVGELSVNQLMVNGKVRPPPVTNRNILLEPKKYYSRMDTSNVHKHDVTGYPMVENAKMDRDYILICRGLWKYFKMFY